jgi:hypothetical protein
MPLLRHTKLPPPPELGEKTFWDYFPRRSMRRVFFLLLAFGAIVLLKRSGKWSFGGLMDTPAADPAGGAPVYQIKVTRPPGPGTPPGSAP